MVKCRKCGRFIEQVKEDAGLSLMTGFPPDSPNTASNVPFSAFFCKNHQPYPRVEYHHVERAE